MKKMLTITCKCNVFENMDEDSNILQEVKLGEKYAYKRIKKHNEKIWYKIILDVTRIGYIKVRNAYSWEKGIVLSYDVALFPEGKDYTEGLKLGVFSIVSFMRPKLNSDSYNIQTKRGVRGIYRGKIVELDLAIFNLIYLLTFIGTSVISVLTMIAGGVIISGAIPILIISGIAIGVTIVIMVLIFMIKLLVYAIKIRL